MEGKRLANCDEKSYDALCRYLAQHLLLTTQKKDNLVGLVHDYSVYHYKNSTVIVDAQSILLFDKPHYQSTYARVKSSDPSQEKAVLDDLENIILQY